MASSEAHIIDVFQIPKHCLLTGETRLWWFWQALEIRFWVADFDRHLDDENPKENIEDIYIYLWVKVAQPRHP